MRVKIPFVVALRDEFPGSRVLKSIGPAAMIVFDSSARRKGCVENARGVEAARDKRILLEDVRQTSSRQRLLSYEHGCGRAYITARLKHAEISTICMGAGRRVVDGDEFSSASDLYLVYM